MSDELERALRARADTGSDPGSFLIWSRAASAARLRRTRRHRVTAAGLVAVAAMSVIAVIAVVGSGDDPAKHVSTPVNSPTTQPSTSTPVTTTSPAPSTTSTTLPVGEDRLSAASRLGYAGLGPIKLGMTFAEAERAGQAMIGHKTTGCPIYELRPGPNSGLAPNANGFYGISVEPQSPFSSADPIELIGVGDAAIYTISGIHVGSTYDDVLRTYPSAVETIEGGGPNGDVYLRLTITNPEGRTIAFHLSPERVVTGMDLGLTPLTADHHAAC